jgi:hypothetical protein
MDTITKFSFFGALILPPIVFIATIAKLQPLHPMKRFLIGVLFACASFTTLMILAVSIFFRDGMGPDSVETHGMEALANCWGGILLAFVIGAILMTFGVILMKWRKRTNNC